MASGDLDRIESALAEAALDSGLWSRALNLTALSPTEIGSVETLPPGDVRIPAQHPLRGEWPVGPSRFVGAARRDAAQRHRTSVRLRDHAIRRASVGAVTLQKNRAINVRS